LRGIDTVLVKLASRCNLDCDYCYVYNMGDNTWRSQPKRISLNVVDVLASQLGELARSQTDGFAVVFHGGEPLLVGPERFDRICAVIRRELPPSCSIHLQTNGLLLTEAVVQTCADYDIGVSISIDGPANVHDRHRSDRHGAPSHARAMAGLRRLLGYKRGACLLTGVLAVIDLRSDPAEVYAFLKSTGTPSIDFLYRDGNRDVLPLGKSSLLSTEYGDWMTRLVDIYLADRQPTCIRVIDDMLKLLMGGRARKEGVGLDAYGILVVDTDGSVNKNDTLKSAFEAADRFGQPWTILTHSLSEIARSSEFETYRLAQLPMAHECLTCQDLTVCGGGMPAHRWSRDSGFASPSVFCTDQRRLIEHMRSHLARYGLAS